MVITRFAPSPTGFLHLGHAHAALFAWRAARAAGGQFLVRIEDIDPTRCRRDFEAAILEDLTWLGLTWDGPVRRQSDHFADYRNALEALKALGVVYPCYCTRAEIRAEVARAASAPHDLPLSGSPASAGGPDGLRYPGTCRPSRLPGDDAGDDASDSAAPPVALPVALRLDVNAALALTGPLVWQEVACPVGCALGEAAREEANREGGKQREDKMAEDCVYLFISPHDGRGVQGGATNAGQSPMRGDVNGCDCVCHPVDPSPLGDVVIARKETPTSYHLSVTVDDHIQGVTLVTRGVDLAPATPIHRLLQALLGYPPPRWHHHRLLTGADGQRFAKRNQSLTLRALRAAGCSPADVRARAGFPDS